MSPPISSTPIVTVPDQSSRRPSPTKSGGAQERSLTLKVIVLTSALLYVPSFTLKVKLA